LKLDLRRLNLRELSGGPGRLVVTLGPQARLNGEKLMKLVQRSRGLYRLTPDLKLVCKLDASVKAQAFLPAARKVVRDLLGCEAT
jgi:transcription-repair coupling factor (superfamily II helicase)